MIILERDGSLLWQNTCDTAADPTCETIDLPANLVTEQSNLIDRVIDFAFDVLGLDTIEVRVREG